MKIRRPTIYNNFIWRVSLIILAHCFSEDVSKGQMVINICWSVVLYYWTLILLMWIRSLLTLACLGLHPSVGRTAHLQKLTQCMTSSWYARSRCNFSPYFQYISTQICQLLHYKSVDNYCQLRLSVHQCASFPVTHIFFFKKEQTHDHEKQTLASYIYIREKF